MMEESSYNNYPHGCPCGYYGDPVKECTYSATVIMRYQKRISGPLLDRTDIHIEVPQTRKYKLHCAHRNMCFKNRSISANFLPSSRRRSVTT